MKEEIQDLKHSIATSALDDLSKIRSFGYGSPENFVKFGRDGNNNNERKVNVMVLKIRLRLNSFCSMTILEASATR